MRDLQLSRRRFLKGLAASGLVGLSAVSAYARLIEPFNYEVTETVVLIRELPAAFDNFRITHLTDLHHGSLVSIREIHRVVELAAATKPDMFALTGDYTTARRRYIEPCAESLGALRAPAGTWAVLGNHDHNNDAELTKRALRRYGVNLLDNESTTLRRGAVSLHLAGIDDWSWGGTEWARALHGIEPDHPSILLSHQPRVLDMAETEGISLILSGHTHGGQIALPAIGSPIAYLTDEIKYLRGLYRRGMTQLYVSRGTGVIGIPVRFCSRPEIAVLTLRRAHLE